MEEPGVSPRLAKALIREGLEELAFVDFLTGAVPGDLSALPDRQAGGPGGFIEEGGRCKRGVDSTLKCITYITYNSPSGYHPVPLGLCFLWDFA